MGALSASELRRIRRSRRSPRITQFDYLHVRRLVEGLAAALERLARPGERVLDVWSGSRPYDDLLPPGAEVVSLDVEGNPYGVADVVSDEFLPFPDASFDGALFVQAFDLVPDPPAAVTELARVLRPGGWAVVTVPFAWEYDRRGPDRRYTARQLASVFEGWEDVEVVENGGRAVAWTTLTASLAFGAEQRLRGRAGGLAHAPFAVVYALVNAVGLALDAIERRGGTGSHALPMNLLLTARRADRASTRRGP
ncbi:MAG TPA: methyltransferase domain-containing protein [Gaiellaceae bacterium]|nr:methyltransferase domain-containing protein [Gaiellaceae bacterium]